MTTSRKERCVYCGQRYVFRSSGNGCGDALNDPRLCPQCKGAVNDALAKLPRLLEPRWVPVAEAPTLAERPTADDCRRWRASRDASHKGPLPPITRIWPGLMDENGSQYIWGIAAQDGPYRGWPFMFQVNEWSDNREPAVVKVQIEVVTATGVPTGSLW